MGLDCHRYTVCVCTVAVCSAASNRKLVVASLFVCAPFCSLAGCVTSMLRECVASRVGPFRCRAVPCRCRCRLPEPCSRVFGGHGLAVPCRAVPCRGGALRACPIRDVTYSRILALHRFYSPGLRVQRTVFIFSIQKVLSCTAPLHWQYAFHVKSHLSFPIF